MAGIMRPDTAKEQTRSLVSVSMANPPFRVLNTMIKYGVFFAYISLNINVLVIFDTMTTPKFMAWYFFEVAVSARTIPSKKFA